MPASNPYNPYFTPGLMPTIIGPEHSVTATLATQIPQAVPIATNAGQPQKRTDRVQVKSIRLVSWIIQFSWIL